MRTACSWRGGLIALTAVCMCLVGCGGGDGGGEGVAEVTMTQTEWFGTVHVGMTVSEVNAALGRPPDGVDFDSRTGARTLNWWRYGNAKGTVTYGTDGKAIQVGYSPDAFGN